MISAKRQYLSNEVREGLKRGGGHHSFVARYGNDTALRQFLRRMFLPFLFIGFQPLSAPKSENGKSKMIWGV